MKIKDGACIVHVVIFRSLLSMADIFNGLQNFSLYALGSYQLSTPASYYQLSGAGSLASKFSLYGISILKNIEAVC